MLSLYGHERPQRVPKRFSDPLGWRVLSEGEATVFKGAAIALLVLLGADQLLNHGQVADHVSAMLKQIVRAYAR